MYQECAFGLTGSYPEPTLYERYEAPPRLPAEIEDQLKAAWRRLLHDLEDGEELIAQLAAAFGKFISFVQVALEVSQEVQGRINVLLKREPAKRPYTGRDLARYAALEKNVDGRNESRDVPFLIDDVGRLLGVTIGVTVDEITITEGVRKSTMGKAALAEVASP
jgi:hypothetical protein